MTHWLYRDWWEYLLSPRRSMYGRSWLPTIWCRMRGHPAGPVWFCSDTEPDMNCKNCGDNVG